MLRLVPASLCGALAGAVVAGSSAYAAEPQPSRFDFLALEHRYDDDQVLAAAQADLASRYPLGSSAEDAARGVAAGGGRCRPVEGAIRCTHASFEAKEDALLEVHWTVRIEADPSGALRTMAVDRSTYGMD